MKSSNLFQGRQSTVLVLLFLICNLLLPKYNGLYAQTIPANNAAGRIVLDVEIKGRDTGRVVLWSADNQNKYRSDIILLDKGRFRFEGTVFRACEAMLWTDLTKRNFDDPQTIRFLMEPGEMKIIFDRANPSDVRISGSELQKEYEQYKSDRRKLFTLKKASADAFTKYYKTPANQSSETLKAALMKSRDSIFKAFIREDADYIRQNPGSFLSPYLLSKHRRELPGDSMAVLFDLLTDAVKQSNLAKVALEDIYPVATSQQFRANNPLTDSLTEAIIAKTKSIHDLSLPDTAGKAVQFASFRGKYLFVDFWASWCKPCIEEIPALHQLMKKYERDPINFVSVSLDRDSLDCRKAIVQHKFEGVHVNDSHAFQGVTAIFNRVLFVPRYVLIDPEGKVLRYDLSYPSEPATIKLLDEILKKPGS